MGIFFNSNVFGIEPINEFEAEGRKLTDDEDNEDEYTVGGTGDGTENGASEEPVADGDTEDGDTGDEYTIEDPDGEETPNDGDGDTEGDTGDDGNPEEGEDTGEDEYTLDDNDATEGEDAADDGEEPAADNEGDTDPEDTNSKLKQLEGELFDQLSPDQQKIKISELKKCYQELYERCDNLIRLLNDVTAPDENSSRVFEYLSDNLTDLKQYIYDYFTYTFETKTYIENSAQYQKYIALLSSLNGILEELNKTGTQ